MVNMEASNGNKVKSSKPSPQYFSLNNLDVKNITTQREFSKKLTNLKSAKSPDQSVLRESYVSKWKWRRKKKTKVKSSSLNPKRVHEENQEDLNQDMSSIEIGSTYFMNGGTIHHAP